MREKERPPGPSWVAVEGPQRGTLTLHNPPRTASAPKMAIDICGIGINEGAAAGPRIDAWTLASGRPIDYACVLSLGRRLGRYCVFFRYTDSFYGHLCEWRAFGNNNEVSRELFLEVGHVNFLCAAGCSPRQGPVWIC